MVLKRIKSKLKWNLVRSCKCKKPYTYWGAIWKIIIRRFQGIPLKVYRCKFCNHYHIGHKTEHAKYFEDMFKFTLFDLVYAQGRYKNS